MKVTDKLTAKRAAWLTLILFLGALFLTIFDNQYALLVVALMVLAVYRIP